MTRFAVLVVFVLMGWATQLSSQDPLFIPTPASPVIVGPGPGQVVLADINRDGHLDMVTRHLLNRSVSVLLGDGKGSFAAVAESPMSFGYQPGAMAVGDVNNDGILDLALTSRDADGEYVHIYLGNGGGGFNPVSGSPFTASASVGFYKPSLRLVDVDEDGKLDIVTANGRRNTIEILFGDGRGGFSREAIVRLEGGQDLYSFALGDVDGDGHLDVVTASSPEPGRGAGRVVTMRGDGKGSFNHASGSPLLVPPSPHFVALADVNGDQRLDIVITHSSNHLSVLLNSGNGMFSTGPASPYDLGTQAFVVVVADVTRDNRNDLLAATVNSVTVLLGDSHGFVPAPGSPFRTGPGAYNLTVGDVNEDGKLDVVASSFEGNAVTVLLAQ